MSLLQEALKRKELEEAQRKPEAGSVEKLPVVLPPDDANLPASRREVDGKDANIPEGPPPQSMPVPAPPQSAASQPANRSLGAGGLILASALALRSLAKDGEPSRLGGAFGEARVAKPGRRKASFLWVIVAMIAILIGLTVAAGFVFFIYRWLPPVKAGIGWQARPVDKTDTIAAGANMVVSRPLPADKREPAAGPETMPHQVIASDLEKDSMVTPARPQPAAVIQNAEPNVVQQQSIGDAARKPVSIKSGLRRDEPAPVRAKALTVSSPAVRWPVLKLTGILHGSGPAESTALINGKMISIGQTIEGVTIVEIQAAGVLLKYGAEKRFLRVGATLY